MRCIVGMEVFDAVSAGSEEDNFLTKKYVTQALFKYGNEKDILPPFPC